MTIKTRDPNFRDPDFNVAFLPIASFRCDATRQLRGSPPHPAQAGADVEPNTFVRRAGGGPACRKRPACFLEQAEQPVRNETRPRRIEVAIALRALAVGEETLRHHEVQM